MARGVSKTPSREEKEKSVLACLEREYKDSRLVNYEYPNDKKTIIASLPNYFNNVRNHGNGNLKKFGRPPKFTPEQLEQELEDFFEYSSTLQIPVNISSMASWLGIDTDTIQRWVRDEAHPLYAITKKAKSDIQAIRLINGEIGATNPIFSMFVLKTMHGFVETSNVNITAQAVQESAENITDLDFERQVKMITDGTIKT